MHGLFNSSILRQRNSVNSHEDIPAAKQDGKSVRAVSANLASLEFFCVRAKNSVIDSASEEVIVEHLYKINHSISLSSSEKDVTSSKIVSLINSGLLEVLNHRLDLQLASIPLFDQVIMLHKRLVVSLLRYDDDTMGSLSEETQRNVAVVIQLFLAHFAHTSLPSIQVLFIEKFIPAVFDLYSKNINLLNSWLQETLQQKGNGQMTYPKNTLPLYSILETSLFSRVSNWVFAEKMIGRLVELSQQAPYLEKWLSESSQLFENLLQQLHKCVDVESTTTTAKLQFSRYSDLLLKIIYKSCDSSIKTDYLHRFQSFTISRFQLGSSTSTIYFVLFMNWVTNFIKNFAPTISDIAIYEMLRILFGDQSFIDQVNNSLQSSYSGNLPLVLMDSILESKSSFFIKEMICRDDMQQLSTSANGHLEEMRMKAMKTSKALRRKDIDDVFVRRMRVLSDLKSTNANNNFSLHGAFDSRKLLPCIMKRALLNFFCNNFERNQILIGIILKCLDYRNYGIVNAFIENKNDYDVNNENQTSQDAGKCVDIKRITDFLCESFDAYNIMVSESNERKYETMNSGTLKQSSFDFLVPTFQLDQDLGSVMQSYNSLSAETLISNIEYFPKYILELYCLAKINQLITYHQNE